MNQKQDMPPSSMRGSLKRSLGMVASIFPLRLSAVQAKPCAEKSAHTRRTLRTLEKFFHIFVIS